MNDDKIWQTLNSIAMCMDAVRSLVQSESL